jgi:hypothetical protein
MAKLAGLQLKVQYKKGSENRAVDALSKVAHNPELFAIFVCQPIWLQEVLRSYELDPASQRLLAEIAVQSPNPQGYIKRRLDLQTQSVSGGTKCWTAY